MTNLVAYEPTRQAGNGVKLDFDFTFKVFDVDDPVVSVIVNSTNVGASKTRVTDYTVTLNASGVGGTICMIVAPGLTVSEDILIEREIPYTQPQNIPDLGNVQESVLEGGYDRNSMLAQQTLELVSRKFGLSVEENTAITGVNFDIQNVVSNGVLQFSSDKKSLTTVALGVLSAIGYPSTNGIAIANGLFNFISRQLSAIGDIKVSNIDGVAGNLIINSSAIDFKIAQFKSSAVGEGAELVKINDVGGLTATSNVEAALQEIYGDLVGTVRSAIGTYTTNGANNRTIPTGIPAGSTLLSVILEEATPGAAKVVCSWHGSTTASTVIGATSVTTFALGTVNFDIDDEDFIVGGNASWNSGARNVAWRVTYTL